MSATIITPKEDVDHHLWYPKRNRVINEYKHIKDYYSWSDEVEKESEYAKGATSPKIYDLRTPQKKLRTKKTYSSNSSDSMFETIDNDNYKPIKTVMESKPTYSNTSSNLVSSLPSNTTLSFVDKILLEESSCAKHSKTGSVNKAKQLQLNPVTVVYPHG